MEELYSRRTRHTNLNETKNNPERLNIFFQTAGGEIAGFPAIPPPTAAPTSRRQSEPITGSDPRLLAEEGVRRRPRDAEAVESQRPVRGVIVPKDGTVIVRVDAHEPALDRDLEQLALVVVDPATSVPAIRLRDATQSDLRLVAVLDAEPPRHALDEVEVGARDLRSLTVDLDDLLTLATREDRDVPEERLDELHASRPSGELFLRFPVNHEFPHIVFGPPSEPKFSDPTILL